MKLWTPEETVPFITAWREAEVVKVVDADTLDLSIDLGFEVRIVTRIRLISEAVITTPQNRLDDGVDAWETRGVERERGLAAKARVLMLCPQGSTVRMFSRRGGSRGKYGRWLAAILYATRNPKTGAVDWRSLGDTLVAEGHAERWT